MTKRYIAILLTISLVTILFFNGCSKQPETISKSGFYFNTIIKITLYDDSYEKLLDDCFDMADSYEKLFSATIDDSDVSRINKANGSPVTVDDETITLIQKGLDYSSLSNGNFDITIGALSSLWDFTNNEGIVPDQVDITAAVETVDYHGVQINGNSVTLTNPNTHIDLGGIAKGYIADKMKEYLNNNGVSSGLINLGGNVLALGAKEDGSSYTIGIQKPFSEDGTTIASVKVTDQTVVSSGVYERYFYVDDTLYHHILNPATGYPYDNKLLGVTIICDNSVDGDGLSTTCFALGLDAGMKLIESLDHTEAIFITDDYELHTSSGLGSSIPYQKLDE